MIPEELALSAAGVGGKVLLGDDGTLRSQGVGIPNLSPKVKATH